MPMTCPASAGVQCDHARIMRMSKPTSAPSTSSSAPEIQGPAGPQLADWNLLRSFNAVFETGTLTEAAKRLGTTQPSVGRHLRELEGLLGETLFVRAPGRLKATVRADALYAATAPMANAVRDAQRLFTESPERIVGTVRVAVAEAHAYHVVTQMLVPLLNEEPELEIELSVSNQADNLLRRDADIAVRFFRPEQDDIIARKVGETELGMYAHQSFIDRFGWPTSFELPAAAFVAGFDREQTPLTGFLHGEMPKAPLRFRFRCDSSLARQAAVESGAGLGVFLVDIAKRNPALRRVLADRLGQPQEIWLCAHDELRRSSRMRFVWDHLATALEARFGQRAAVSVPTGASLPTSHVDRPPQDP